MCGLLPPRRLRFLEERQQSMALDRAYLPKMQLGLSTNNAVETGADAGGSPNTSITECDPIMVGHDAQCLGGARYSRKNSNCFDHTSFAKRRNHAQGNDSQPQMVSQKN